MIANEEEEKSRALAQFGRGIARAFGGSLLFTAPLFMTMEMWYLGFYMDRWRLALLLTLLIPLLIGLSYKAGFKEDFNFLESILDAFAAFAIAFFSSSFLLWIFGVINFDMSMDEMLGMTALQTVPASIGALLGRTQLGEKKIEIEKGKTESKYFWELFIMGVGALFLALNLSPTEEMILISYMTNEYQAIGLIFISLIIMHSFVYKIEFKGQEAVPEGIGIFSMFLRYTVAGYALVIIISIFILWIFGRMDGMSLRNIIVSAVVLSFPGSLGAAAARLIL